MRTFNDPGTYQFEKADFPWLARVRVKVQGGGGGSAGANAAANQCIVRPCGAGGGYSESLIEASALGAVETIVVGAGGEAGTTAESGGAGGSSSLGGFVLANGGDGGHAIQDSATVPDVSTGAIGPLAGRRQFAHGGGAGGGAIRLNGTNGISGAGGESFMGHGGYARASEGAGTAPRGFGAGAGGGLSYGGSVAGQEGGGIVIIELYG
ncbi:hypothetical protein ACFY5C_11695 [Streptomyces sp. NPDC012935]|uniref:glycine-rich domain-containing protein n=1 Tax=Streptomyces sp. NPDC012935 TaxID=3364857 RepID=UPI0036860B40